MANQRWCIFAVGATLASGIFAQGYQRQAAMVGGGGPDHGKCTVEVVVDDVAEVEIRGTAANLRTISGQPAQWRRFECTGALPTNPGNFRFSGVDGRGRQTLIRDPRNGGVAVVQIEDKDGGAEGYTFDIVWDSRAGGGYPSGGGYAPPPVRRDEGSQYGGQYRPNYRDSDYYRRYRHGFGVDEAIRVCQQSITSQASRRFRRARDMHFHQTAIDDAPGRQDWITGMLDVHHANGSEDRYRFSCSVDFESGRVRTATLDPRPIGDDPRWHQ